MVNLRRYARLRAEVDVDYRIIGTAKAHKVRTKSYNISIGGICFEVQDRLKVGTRVGLQIFLDPSTLRQAQCRPEQSRGTTKAQGQSRACRGIEKDNPIKVEGNVIWQKSFEDGTSRAGVSFIGLKEEDKERFSNFIFRKMYEMTGVGSRTGLVKYAKEHGWKEIKE